MTRLLTPYELASDFCEGNTGAWMMGWDRQMKVEQRVACPEIGYPVSEALYPDIEAWEAATGKKWYEEFSP